MSTEKLFAKIISLDKYKIIKKVRFLPFERKVWKIYLLSIITLSIYGIVVQWAMAKETNISCVEDGR